MRSRIGARFLILDEPTASLESSAIERLFERVRRMKESGVAILYISHHLEEIYEICDAVTVLRDGRRIVTAPVAELDHDRLVAAMVGGELARRRERRRRARRPAGAHAPAAGTCSVRSPLGDVAGRRASRCTPASASGSLGSRGSGSVAIADAVAGLVKPAAGDDRARRRGARRG